MSPISSSPRIIGYARASTAGQDLAYQLKRLEDAGCDVIYQEKRSGKNASERPELNALLASLGANANASPIADVYALGDA